MKFRTKLFYAFISLGLLSTLVALFIVFGEASRMIFSEIQSKVLSLAISSRELIDLPALDRMVQGEGQADPVGAAKLKQQLIHIQKLNRRADVYAERVYIIQRYQGSSRYFFILGSETGEGPIPMAFGNPYPSSIKTPPGPPKPFVSTHIYAGEKVPISWISGYAPLTLPKGEEIGLLGIDIQAKEVYRELERLLLHGIGGFAISIFVAVIFAYFLSNLVSSSLSMLCTTVQKIGGGDLSARSKLDTQDEFNDLSEAINDMARGLEERERLKVGFARYVSQYALEELLKLDQPITLEGERKKVTILFSDIRNFTTLAEKLAPEQVLKLLNEYFEEMIEVIFQYGGTLDKFIGDGLMVEFGAPLEDAEQELHALLAAIQMQHRLQKLSSRWEKEGRHQFEMGIGIHTGLAVLGNIGSVRRMEYTAIGDTVNIAARLEQMTKKVKKMIIVSESVYEKTKGNFDFEDLKQVEIPGREGYIQAYSLDPFAQKNLDQVGHVGDVYNLPSDD
ncbi:MAG: adenylate/guanylate cyclase domain-containing protein [Chlamydiota bacterium]